MSGDTLAENMDRGAALESALVAAATLPAAGQARGDIVQAPRGDARRAPHDPWDAGPVGRGLDRVAAGPLGGRIGLSGLTALVATYLTLVVILPLVGRIQQHRSVCDLGGW